MPGLAASEQYRVTGVLEDQVDSGYRPLGYSRYIGVDEDWKFHTFVFETTFKESRIQTDTVKPARLDFGIKSGNTIYIDNVFLEEVTVDTNDTSDDAVIVTNPASMAATFDCLDVITDADRCDEYVYFTDASVVTWPVTVPAYGSHILVWAGNPFRDTDRDGVLDNVDNCPIDPNPYQLDSNGDGVGDVCDADSDGVPDSADNCPNDQNPNQDDLDGDGIGDVCDNDIDGDGALNTADCDATDASIYPGATEVIRDNIHQDCNGQDLTIIIIEAKYNVNKEKLEVKAESLLNEAANLNLDNFGPMEWRRKKGHWRKKVKNVATNPVTVTVSGPEGAVTTAVTLK